MAEFAYIHDDADDAPPEEGEVSAAQLARVEALIDRLVSQPPECERCLDFDLAQALRHDDEEKSDLVHRLLSEGCTHLIGKLCEYNRDAKIILDGGSPQLERIMQEQERLATRQFYSILQKVMFRTFSGTCEPWILADAWNVVEGGDTYHRYVTLRKFHGAERDRQEQLYEQHLKALPLDQRLEQRARDAIQLIQWLIAETQQEQAEERQKFSAEDLADLDAQRTHIAQRIEAIVSEMMKDR